MSCACETARPSGPLLDRVNLGMLGALALAMLLYAPRAVEESHDADFANYYTAGWLALHDRPLYDRAFEDRLAFAYPPFVAQLLMPVAWFGETWAGEDAGADRPTPAGQRAGAALWYLLLCGCYLLALVLAVGMTRPTSPGMARWIGALAFLVSARPLLSNLRLGQINLPMILGGVAAAWMFTRGRSRASGLLAACGAAIKFIPGGLVFWFLRRRSLPGIAWLSLGCTVLFFGVPMLSWGPTGTVRLWREYGEKRGARVLGQDASDEQAAGQSLSSLCRRLLTRTNAVTPRRGEPLYINLADSPTLARGVRWLLVAGALALALLWMRGRVDDPPWRGALEAGVLFLLFLLISPESRRAHFVTLFVPVAALVRHALSVPGARRLLAWLVPVFAFSALSSRGILEDSLLYFTLNAYGVMLWSALILFGVLLHCLRQLPENPLEAAAAAA